MKQPSIIVFRSILAVSSAGLSSEDIAECVAAALTDVLTERQDRARDCADSDTIETEGSEVVS